MQYCESYIDAVAEVFDQAVATATDDELFAGGYLRGHFDLAVGGLLVAAEPFTTNDIQQRVDASVADAIARGELNDADAALVLQLWQQLKRLA